MERDEINIEKNVSQDHKGRWHRREKVALGMALLATLGFSLLAYLVKQQPTPPFDVNALLYIHSTASAWQDVTWQVITEFGGVVAVVLIVVVVSGVLLCRGYARAGLQFVASVAGAMALSATLKVVFSRERPELWERLIMEATHSFPSGHAIASSAIAFGLMVLLWRTRWSAWVIVGGIVYVGLISYSRMYLGVHYPTDIIAGWLVSIAWVSLMVVAFMRSRVY